MPTSNIPRLRRWPRRAIHASRLLQTIALLGLLIAAPTAARADAAKQKITDLELELMAGVLFDNNAALGRRGLFNAAKIQDVTSVFVVRSSLRTDLHAKVRFLLTGKLRVEEGRWQQFLRNTELSAKPTLEFDLGKSVTIAPSVNFKLRHEVESLWSYVEVAPGLLFRAYTRFGVIFEASYDFTATSYDHDEDTVTYANVDRLSHKGKLQAKIWQTKKLRYTVKAEVEHQRYDDNIGESLALIAFTPIEQFGNPDVVPEIGTRRDLYLRAELEVLFIPLKYFAFAVSYQVEWDNSNLDPYRNWNHGPRVAVLFARKKHEAFVEARLTLSDFYDFRFDTRYINTRQDLRAEGFAGYQYSFKGGWKVGAKLTFKSSHSNDADKFDDGSYRFNALHSRSFSRYDGFRAEAFLSYTWDVDNKKPAKPAPASPGIASRFPRSNRSL